MDDDAFWQVEMLNEGDLSVRTGRSLDELAPNEQELAAPDSVANAFVPVTFQTHPLQELRIEYVECRDLGVLDIIGGELWEAALLLCGYMTVCRPDLISRHILELGSGVGAVGCYVAALQALEQQGSITMTDYDGQLLTNLCHAIARTFPHAGIQQAPSAKSTSKDDEQSLTPYARVAQLDWTQFAQEATSHCGEFSDIDCVIGSALVYGPQHACVADVLKGLLKPNAEAVVIQLSTRPGFERFLERLQALGMPHSLEPVPMEAYEFAQRMTVQETGTPSIRQLAVLDDVRAPFLRTQLEQFTVCRVFGPSFS